MRFWELVSIMRTQREDLENLLQDARWSKYRMWYADMARIVDVQDRDILDSIVAEDLAIAAMTRFRERFQVQDGYIYGAPKGVGTSASLSALETYRRFGATAIEDTLERGATRIGTD